MSRIEEVTNGQQTKRTIQLTSADTIEPEPVDWFWDMRAPSGTLGLLAGREGLGKTTVMADVIAKTTRGTLEGIHFGTPRTVFIAATEDSWAHVIVPRLMAVNADLTRVKQVEAKTPTGAVSELILPVDLEALQQAILDQGDVALLLLDPLLSRLSGKLDTHKDAEVRRALEPVVRLAVETGIAVIGIIHVNKSTTSDPLNAIMGSRAFTAVSRFALFVVEDPNDDSSRLLGVPKNNYGPTNRNTLTFSIEEYVFNSAKGRPIKTSRVKWTGSDPRSIKEILKEAQVMKAPTALGEALRWLKQFLEQNNGASESKTIKAAGLALGHHDKALQKAARTLQVTFHPVGMPAKMWWVMPGSQVPLP